MIRGKRPRLYDTDKKSYQDVMIPALSIDFENTENLTTVIGNIHETLLRHDNILSEYEAFLSQAVQLPIQKGKLFYTGYEQAPILIYDSARISLSGQLSGTVATEYTATATLLSGKWYDNSTATSRSFKWRIEKGKLAKPYQARQYMYTGAKQTLELENFLSNIMTKRNNSVFEATAPGEYTAVIGITDTNYTWYDGKSTDYQIKWRIFPDSYPSDDTGQPADSGIDSDTAVALINALSIIEGHSNTLKNLREELDNIKKVMITSTMELV